MKQFVIVLTLLLVACGPRVRDKDKPGSSNANNTSQNGAPNNAVANNGTPNNGAPNNGTPNNGTPNNTNPNNTNPNNTNPNNTNPNNTNPNNTNPNNTNPNNTTIPPDVVAKCGTACELFWGNCLATRCSFDGDTQRLVDDIYDGCRGVGGDAGELCTTRYQNEPGYRDLVDTIVAENNCNGPEIELTHCATFGTDECNCPVPDLGEGCTSDAQCDGGLLSAGCQPEDAGLYPGGQCLAGGCLFENEAPGTLLVGSGTLCGDMGICYVADATSSVCLPRCFSNSDCDRGITGPNQSGYACALLGTIDDFNGGTELLGYCDTACGEQRPCDAGICSNEGACTDECFFDSDCPVDFSCTGVNGDDQMYCEYTG